MSDRFYSALLFPSAMDVLSPLTYTDILKAYNEFRSLGNRIPKFIMVPDPDITVMGMRVIFSPVLPNDCMAIVGEYEGDGPFRQPSVRIKRVTPYDPLYHQHGNGD